MKKLFIAMALMMALSFSSCTYFGKECYYAISSVQHSADFVVTHMYIYSVKVYYAKKDKFGINRLTSTFVTSKVSTKQYANGTVLYGNKEKVLSEIH